MSALPDVHSDPLHERGRAAVLGGTPTYDVPPGPSSTRWGLSVVLRPDEESALLLDDLTHDLGELAGPHQWRTGGRGASHLTVADVEAYRDGVTADEPAVRRDTAALGARAYDLAPARFTIAGLLLTPGGVLARTVPVDAATAGVRATVLDALPRAVTYMGPYRQGRWWSTLIHITGPVARPAALVEWVDARVDSYLGEVTAPRLELVRYAYDGTRTVPVPLAGFDLTA